MSVCVCAPPLLSQLVEDTAQHNAQNPTKHIPDSVVRWVAPVLVKVTFEQHLELCEAAVCEAPCECEGLCALFGDGQLGNEVLVVPVYTHTQT